MQITTKNVSNNKSTTPNFVRSSQESFTANSLVIYTNDATKGKSDESLKIEQIEIDQTSNIEDEETDEITYPTTSFTKVTILQ